MLREEGVLDEVTNPRCERRALGESDTELRSDRDPSGIGGVVPTSTLVFDSVIEQNFVKWLKGNPFFDPNPSSFEA